MKEPQLLAELSGEALQADEGIARQVIAELREAGKIIEGDQLTWTWGPGGVGRLWLGEPPPRVGAVVQTSAAHHWPHCLFVVTEPRNWGVVAELRLTHGMAPIRLAWEDFEVVGHVKGPASLLDGLL
jgi:hypothetical protein